MEKMEKYLLIHLQNPLQQKKGNLQVFNTQSRKKELMFNWFCLYHIGKGVNIVAQDKFEHTSLHIECHFGRLPIVQYLIEKEVNIEA